MNRIEITRKKIILLCLFLGIFVIGTVLIFIIPIGVKATYNKTVQTSDGITVSFNVFEPKISGTNKKAVILGHGVMSNKEMLKDFGIEFAAAGFVAVPFDFRGHGQSTGEHRWGSLTNDILALVVIVVKGFTLYFLHSFVNVLCPSPFSSKGLSLLYSK